MFDRTDLSQEEIDWLLAHPELNALLMRLAADSRRAKWVKKPNRNVTPISEARNWVKTPNR